MKKHLSIILWAKFSTFNECVFLFVCLFLSEGSSQEWPGRKWVGDGLSEASVWGETAVPSACCTRRVQAGNLTNACVWSCVFKSVNTKLHFKSDLSVLFVKFQILFWVILLHMHSAEQLVFFSDTSEITDSLKDLVCFTTVEFST